MSNAEVCILIGDQDVGHCIFLQELCAAHGLAAHCVSHPHLVVPAIHETFYNLVFLDSLMAKASGLKVLTDIAALRPQSKIVVLTDAAHPDLALASLQVGAFDVLEKPLTADSLLRTIRRALDIQKNELGHQHILEEILALEAQLLRKTSDALQGFAYPMKNLGTRRKNRWCGTSARSFSR